MNPHATATTTRRRCPHPGLAAAAMLIAGAAAGIAGCGASGQAGTTSPAPTVTVPVSKSPAGPAPPPLSAHGPDVFRLRVPPMSGIPVVLTDERLSDGTTVRVGLGSDSVHSAGGKLSAAFTFEYPGGPASQDRAFRMAEGQSRDIGKYRFQVLKLWSMPDPLNDAADVRITPLG